jgi:hypothetical protein
VGERIQRLLPCVCPALPPGGDRLAEERAGSPRFRQPGGPGDFHIQNYTFYFANIRENASARVGAFLAQRSLRKGRASGGTPDI